MENQKTENFINELDAGKVYFFKQSLGPEHSKREYKSVKAGVYEIHSSFINARTGDRTTNKREYTREQLAKMLENTNLDALQLQS